MAPVQVVEALSPLCFGSTARQCGLLSTPAAKRPLLHVLIPLSRRSGGVGVCKNLLCGLGGGWPQGKLGAGRPVGATCLLWPQASGLCWRPLGGSLRKGCLLHSGGV